MSKFSDLTGQQFGHWKVESYAGSKKWWCVCVCGKKSQVFRRNLCGGGSLSCGCRAKDGIRLELSGQRFGRWVALSYDTQKQKWLCRCDCGNERLVMADNLRAGGTNSCGCVSRSGEIRRSVPGVRYGHWVLIEYIADNVWSVRCDCGTLDTKRESVLKIGSNDASCGCVSLTKTHEKIAQLEQALPKPRHSPLLKDLTGQRIGGVVPLEYLGSGKWLCRCDCGNVKPLAIGGLRSGKTRSCGCARIRSTISRNKKGVRVIREDLTGQTFGRLQVLSAVDRWHWRCRCSCGTDKVVQHHNLTRGMARSCGCFLREQNAKSRRYETREARDAARNERLRLRRESDATHAEAIRARGQLSALRSRLTPEGKARMAAVHTRRRARCSGAIPATDWLRVLEAWGHRCAYCDKPANSFTQDHVTPLNCGGRHELDNVVPACRRCNSRKSDLDLEVALARLGCTNFHERREAANLFLKDTTNA